MFFWRALRGRERLARVFWWYYALIGSVVAFAPGLFAEGLYDRGVALWCFVVLAVFQALYLLWLHLALWMCAFNAATRAWGFLVRAYVGCAAVWFAVYQLMPLPQTPPRFEVILY